MSIDMQSRQEMEEELHELYLIEERLLRQQLYTNNLFELCKLMGFMDLGKAHTKLCHEMERTRNLYRRRLFLFFRGFFKTSVITQADTVQEIIRNSNIRILIASSTLDNAKDSLKVIKNTFWVNEEFRKVFPDYCPVEGCKEFGTQVAFTVPNRTLVRLKEETVECAGVGQTLTGKHYNIIKLCDIVTDKNVNTRATMKKTSDWVAYALSLLENPAHDRVDCEGTTYDYFDFHAEWREKARKNRQEYFVMVGPIETKGVPLFPERFTMEDIRKIEVDQGSAIFSGQYRLEPINEGTAIFKKDQIKYVDRAKLPRTQERAWAYPRYMTVDPAISEDTHADYSVITVSMFDTENMEYVVDMQYGHWGIKELGERILKFYKIYTPERIGIESIAFQKLLFYIFDEMYRTEKLILPWIELKRDTRRTKAMRIKSLQPRFEQHKILFVDDLDKVYLENQLLRFDPDKKTNEDDFLDTLTDMETIKTIPVEEIRSIYELFPQRRYIDWLNTPKDDREDEFFRKDEEEATEREYYANAPISFN